MTNEGWQTLSQVIAALGIVLSALGAFGAYIFGEKIAMAKAAQEAMVGTLKPLVDVVLSARDSVWPKLEFGDSGAIIVYTGPKATPMIKFAEDSDLIIVRENGHLKVSTVVRDRTWKLVAELVKNEWTLNPGHIWDRNYTSDTLEAKDPSGDVVLQIRVLPDRVQLQGKFNGSDGHGVAFGKILGPIEAQPRGQGQ